MTQVAAPALLLGGAHGGKSELAMQLLLPDAAAAVLGTAAAHEPAFKHRLAQLKSARPPAWDSLDVGTDLSATLQAAFGRYPQVLVDSVSQWLAAVILAAGSPREELVAEAVQGQVDELIRVIQDHQDGVRLVLVSAEVGQGPAPARGMERVFRQQVGLANRRLAELSRTVLLVSAGLPLLLKGTP